MPIQSLNELHTTARIAVVLSPPGDLILRLRRLLSAAVAALAVSAVSAAAAPMVVMYGTADTNRKIIKPGAPDALPVDGRLFVVEPNAGHLFAGDADKPYRLHHVMTKDLLAKGNDAAMAAHLKAQIDSPVCQFTGYTVDCGSGMVFVDEIDWRWAEKAPNLNTPAWRGRTSRSQPKRKFPNYVPKAREGHPGVELSQAMETLAATPHPAGGSYADRVHFFIAPGVVTSIGVGRGKYHNLGRDGRPHFRSHEGMRRALQLAGGVWLEMYHYDHSGRGRYPFNTYEWQTYPWRFSQYLTGIGVGRPDQAMVQKLRFIISNGKPKAKGGAPAVCRSKTSAAMDCVFTLANSVKNRQVLMNGIGQYRMEGDEARFRQHVKRLFFPELP